MSITEETAVVAIDETTVALWEYQGTNPPSDYYYAWTRDDIETMVERVNRGALLLDNDQPDWNYQVIPERLDLSSAALCIVGQAYGDYDKIGPIFARQKVEEYEAAETGGEEDLIAEQYGFITTDEDGIPWALMDRVWTYLIQERATAGRPLTLALPAQEPRNIALQRLIDAKLISAEL